MEHPNIGVWVHLGPGERKGVITEVHPQREGDPADRWWVTVLMAGTAKIGQTVWADDYELRDGEYYPKQM